MAVPKIEERVNIPIDADKVKKTKRTAKTKPTKAKSEVKTKRLQPGDQKKKKKIYTAEELGVPKLNGIVPSGVQKPKGKKKGKIFVDDAKSMMAILGMVQAEKEGEVEGKMVKARQLEEIREAKRVEAEQRFEARKEKMEERKDAIRKMKRRNRPEKNEEDVIPKTAKPFKISKKKVSFG